MRRTLFLVLATAGLAAGPAFGEEGGGHEIGRAHV